MIIDISKNNGVVDWKKVKAAGCTGAILKATEGATVRDKRVWDNITGCEANGIPWGLYHFATWNNEDEAADATQEAKFFLSVLGSHKPTLPLVLDIESNKPIPYTKDEMVLYVKTFTDIVKAAGFEIAIYSSPGFLQSYLPANHPFTDLKLWVADYTGPINPVPGWKKIWLHQYTDQGKIDGVGTAVDLNRLVA